MPNGLRLVCPFGRAITEVWGGNMNKKSFLCHVLSATLCMVVLGAPQSGAQAAQGFDFPIGNPDHRGYSVTGFDFRDETSCPRANGRVSAIHPGEDWNSNREAGADRDDPILAAADGTIEWTGYGGPGWGNVVLIRHNSSEYQPFILPDGTTATRVWSQYAHMSAIAINPSTQRKWKEGHSVARGQQIGTVGDVLAGSGEAFHLHFEIRKVGPDELGPLAFPCGRSSFDPKDLQWLEARYVHPTQFIDRNRASGRAATGFWHLLDLQRSPTHVYPQDEVNISVLAPDINPTLVTLPPGDNGFLPHSICGRIASCLTSSYGVWWYGVNNHTHSPSGARHGTFIDWVFEPSIQTPKNGGLSSARNFGRLVFDFDLTSLDAPLLQFTTWWEIESVDAHAFDLMQVLLIDGNGVEHHLRTLNPTVDVNGRPDQPYTSSGFNVPARWVDKNIDLSLFSGQKVQIVFFFDTRDSLYNGFRGWFIDRPNVTSLSSLNLFPLRTQSIRQPEPPRQPGRPRD